MSFFPTQVAFVCIPAALRTHIKINNVNFAHRISKNHVLYYPVYLELSPGEMLVTSGSGGTFYRGLVTFIAGVPGENLQLALLTSCRRPLVPVCFWSNNYEYDR